MYNSAHIQTRVLIRSSMLVILKTGIAKAFLKSIGIIKSRADGTKYILTALALSYTQRTSCLLAVLAFNQIVTKHTTNYAIPAHFHRHAVKRRHSVHIIVTIITVVKGVEIHLPRRHQFLHCLRREKKMVNKKKTTDEKFQSVSTDDPPHSFI